MSEPIIGINQRIPLAALEVCFIAFLKGQYEPALAREQLQVSFSGENRLRKGTRQIGKMLSGSLLTPLLKDQAPALLNAVRSMPDRNLLLISLLTAAYPFAFDTLRTYGKYFQVQSQVSNQVIKKNLANKYGGHRATENAISSINTMLVESKLISRVKPGLFEKEQPKMIREVSRKVYNEAFLANIHQDSLSHANIRDPYFQFVVDSQLNYC